MIVAYICAKNVEETANFYTQKLGFSMGIQMPDAGGKLDFAIVKHGEMTVMVGSLKSVPNTTPENLGNGVQFWFYPQDVELDAMYNAIKSKNVAVVEELQDGYWGDRYFTVTDPNGYRLTFAATVKEMSHDEIKAAAAG